ncbi:MAG: hypothetical protein HRU35_03080 [Rickettsiaceae bacterium]|nr:hypothetical protein [Rickettsiaceae bacterium]
MNEEVKQYLKPGKKNLIGIYVLYLLGITIVGPILPIIGVIFAYANKDNTTQTWKSHYIFALRSFVFGILIYFIIEEIIGFSEVIIIDIFGEAIRIWVIVRSIVAMQFLLEEVKHPNPLTLWVK